MAVAFVATKGSNQNASNGSTVAVTTNAAIANGEFVIVLAGCQDTSGNNISGTPTLGSLTFTPINNAAMHDGKFASNGWIAQNTGSSIASGSTLTVPVVSTCTSRMASCLTFTGLNAATLALGVGAHSQSLASTTAPSSGAGGTASTSGVAVGLMLSDAPNTTTFTNGGSMTAGNANKTAGTGTTAMNWSTGYQIIAPAGSGTASCTMAGTLSASTSNTFSMVVAVADTQSANLTGPAVGLALDTPLPTVLAVSNVNLTGPAAGLALAAPVGTVSTTKTVNLTLVPADLALVMPVAAFSGAANVPGPVTGVTLSAPVGTLSASVNAVGPVVGLTLAAPAPAVSISSPAITLSAPVVGLTLSAPLGTVTVTSDVNLALPVGSYVLRALAGSVDTQRSTLWYFYPPIYKGAPEDIRTPRLFLFYSKGFNYGLSLLKYGDDDYRVIETPTTEEIQFAEKSYLGGRTYVVNDAEAALLAAAGYDELLVSAPADETESHWIHTPPANPPTADGDGGGSEALSGFGGTGFGQEGYGE